MVGGRDGTERSVVEARDPAGPAGQTVTVVVIDDHPTSRLGTHRALEEAEGLTVLASVAGPEELNPEDPSPDVVVTEILPPAPSSASCIERVLGRFTNARILVFSRSESPSDVHACLEAGAQGYVSKRSDPAVLVEGVRRVARGEGFLDPSVAARILAWTRDRERLSARELRVLGLAALGLTNTEIARRLHLAVRTVEAHRTSLRRKLGIRTRAEWVRWGVLLGVLDLGVPDPSTGPGTAVDGREGPSGDGHRPSDAERAARPGGRGRRRSPGGPHGR